MSSFRLSAKAKSDLKLIAVFTERRWGKDQRNHYLHQFDACFRKLAENPSMGTVCDTIRPGYRKFPNASHVIFYRMGEGSCLEIIRILHNRMDVSPKRFEA